MSSVQLHLGLTHAPVIILIIGTLIFIASFFFKNPVITRLSYILLLSAGITTIPVFLTGEGAEEAVENLPGVYESIIEKHEEIAKFAAISIAAVGLFSLIALLSYKSQKYNQILKLVVLLLAIISSTFMAQTAHLGGQIRHTEIRASNEQNKDIPKGEPQQSNKDLKEKDND